MNLLEYVSTLQTRTGMVDVDYRPKFVRFVNDSIREFARRWPWESLEGSVDLKSDGTKYLVLPHYIDTVISILNLTDVVPVNSSGDFDREATTAEAQGTTGRVSDYQKAGDVPATQDPAGYCYLRSTHASDTSLVYICGLAANSGASGALESTYRETSATLYGSTAVTLSTLFTRLFSVSKATETSGDVFLHDAGTGNAQISFIPKAETCAKFKRVQLMFAPDSQKQFRVRFRYKIPPLTQDSQSPHPAVKDDFIIQYAMALHLNEQEQYQKQVLAEQKATAILEAEANRESNFDEPYSQIIPQRPFSSSEDDDYYSIG